MTTEGTRHSPETLVPETCPVRSQFWTRPAGTPSREAASATVISDSPDLSRAINSSGSTPKAPASLRTVSAYGQHLPVSSREIASWVRPLAAASWIWLSPAASRMARSRFPARFRFCRHAGTTSPWWAWAWVATTSSTRTRRRPSTRTAGSWPVVIQLLTTERGSPARCAASVTVNRPFGVCCSSRSSCCSVIPGMLPRISDLGRVCLLYPAQLAYWRPASCLSRGETATRPRRLQERHDGPLHDPGRGYQQQAAGCCSLPRRGAHLQSARPGQQAGCGARPCLPVRRRQSHRIAARRRVALSQRRAAERDPAGAGSLAHGRERLQSSNLPRRGRGRGRSLAAAGR